MESQIDLYKEHVIMNGDGLFLDNTGDWTNKQFALRFSDWYYARAYMLKMNDWIESNCMVVVPSDYV